MHQIVRLATHREFNPLKVIIKKAEQLLWAKNHLAEIRNPNYVQSIFIMMTRIEIVKLGANGFRKRVTYICYQISAHLPLSLALCKTSWAGCTSSHRPATFGSCHSDRSYQNKLYYRYRCQNFYFTSHQSKWYQIKLNTCFHLHH